MRIRCVSSVATLAVMACAARAPTSAPHAVDSPAQTPRSTAGTRTDLGKAQKQLLGIEVSADRAAALATLFADCKRGDVGSCVAVLSAPDLVTEHRIAEAVLRKPCIAGDVRACRHAARGLPPLVADIKRICEQNVPYACAMAAASDNQAELGRACDMGDPDACERAARGDASSRFSRRARELRLAGCKSGFVLDCIDGSLEIDRRTLMPLCLEGDVSACAVAVSDDATVQETGKRIACAIDQNSCVFLAKLMLSRGDLAGIIGARHAYATGCEAAWRAPSSRAADCSDAARTYALEPAEPEQAERMRQLACTLEPKNCGEIR